MEGTRELSGPWDQAFCFPVDFEMRSKSNHRRYVSGKGGRDNWRSLQDFEKSLSLLARSARPSGWDMGEPERPLPERPMVVSFVFARSVLDAANLSKSVLDACEGVVFHNDASVRYCGTLGVRTRTNPGGLVAFAALPAGSSVVEVLAASWALQAACLPMLGEDSPTA